jgi:ribonuclease HII
LAGGDLFEHERAAWRGGARRIAGIDEAGRGPLAGPVVAAAVLLPFDFDLTGINDSKKLSPDARASAFARLLADTRVIVGVGLSEPDEIDRINILRATHEAMRRALAALGGDTPDFVLVDGLPVPHLHPRCTALVKGDSRSASIAAASIVAKVTRDRLMAGQYHAAHPEYDFARHKGYPTPDHLRALAQHGPCAIHRRSFAPVAQCALRFEGTDGGGG